MGSEATPRQAVTVARSRASLYFPRFFPFSLSLSLCLYLCARATLPSRFHPLFPILRRVRCGATQRKRGPRLDGKLNMKHDRTQGTNRGDEFGRQTCTVAPYPPFVVPPQCKPGERAPRTQNCWNRLTLREEKDMTVDLDLSATLAQFRNRAGGSYGYAASAPFSCSSHPEVLAP